MPLVPSIAHWAVFITNAQPEQTITYLYALATVDNNCKQSFTLDINITRIADSDTGKTIAAGYYCKSR